MSCVVRGCPSVWVPQSNIKFHNFPSDPIQKQVWLSSILLKGKYYNSARICSKHFKPEDYDPDRPKRLLKSAIPVTHHQTCCDCALLNIKDDPEIVCEQKELPNFENNPSLPRRVFDYHWAGSNISTLQTVTVTPDIAVELDSLPLPITTDLSVQVKLKTPHEKALDSLLLPVTTDFSVQVKLKTPHEKALVQKNKILQQKVRRQKRKIIVMKKDRLTKLKTKDFKGQVRFMTPLEKSLEQKTKMLLQQVRRQKQQILEMQEIINEFRKKETDLTRIGSST